MGVRGPVCVCVCVCGCFSVGAADVTAERSRAMVLVRLGLTYRVSGAKTKKEGRQIFKRHCDAVVRSGTQRRLHLPTCAHTGQALESAVGFVAARFRGGEDGAATFSSALPPHEGARRVKVGERAPEPARIPRLPLKSLCTARQRRRSALAMVWLPSFLSCAAADWAVCVAQLLRTPSAAPASEQHVCIRGHRCPLPRLLLRRAPRHRGHTIVVCESTTKKKKEHVRLLSTSRNTIRRITPFSPALLLPV